MKQKIITVNAKGVRKVKSKLRPLSQILCYSELELYKKRGDVFTLTGGMVIDSFYRIASNVDAFCVAGKISRILLSVLQPELPDMETMRLTLNTFYYLSKDTRNPRLLQVVFMIYLMGIQGVLPDAESVLRQYGKTLSPGARKGFIHIMEAEMETLFRFTVSDTILEELESLCDKLEREFI